MHRRETEDAGVEILFGLGVNLLLLLLCLPIFWAIGFLSGWWQLARGFALLWLLLILINEGISLLYQWFRIDLYTHGNVYLVCNLVLSCLLQMGWSAFAALTLLHGPVALGGWTLILLAIVALLSCLVAFFIVSSIFRGVFYRLISLPVALVSLLLFGLWPAAAHFLYGWFFQWF